MKRILLFTLASIAFNGYSQSLSLSKLDGTPINNNQVFGYNEAGDVSEFKFRVTNLSSTQSANVKIVCETIVNTTGEGLQICYGNECLSGVQEGDVYPTSGDVILPPNGINGNFDHLLKETTGSGPYPHDYTFRFYQINDSGVEIGNSITMTYRFDPNLSVDELNQIQTAGVIVKSTFVKNQLELDVLKSSNLSIYSINGKLMYNSVLNYGLQNVDVSNFSSGIYIVQFESEGTISSKKIIKE